MDILLVIVIALVALALVFDFTNGFHDAANTVATVVATRALPAKWAPAFAAFFNFTAYFIVGTAVASTIAKTVKTDGMDQSLVIKVIFAALFAAIAWNYATWFFGMPSSSSHAIIGGLVGAGLAAGGLDAISWDSVSKSAAGIIASPLVAVVIATLVFYLLVGIARLFKLHDNHGTFKGVQLFSSAWMSFGHGANDAQKTMGVIGALLVGTGYVEMGDDGKIPIPEWAALAAYSAIAIGTLWGGWKIIETMGLKITTLNAISGAAANIGAAVSIQGATSAGVPISTTHAAASSVVGAGVASGRGANWKVVGEMVTAWVLTIPSAATIAFVMTKFTQLPTAFAWLTTGSAVAGFAVWAVWAMLNTIHASDVAAEIPPEEELEKHVPVHPHLVGEGPVPAEAHTPFEHHHESDSSGESAPEGRDSITDKG